MDAMDELREHLIGNGVELDLAVGICKGFVDGGVRGATSVVASWEDENRYRADEVVDLIRDWEGVE